MKYKALSIAGFDGSGGAGLQADLKTFSALGCYGMTVLTALPVQNTCGVKLCYNIPLKAIKEQLETIFEDIIPDSIKIGMLFNSEIIELVTEFLKHNAKNIPIIVDPVMRAKNGDSLLLPESVKALQELLLPIATIITPNLPEALELTSMQVNSYEDMLDIAKKLLSFGSNSVLLKAGHLEGDTSNDLFIDQHGNRIWLNSSKIISKNTHGTGCTLSAAIAAYLASGHDLLHSCQLAKNYLHGAIAAAKDEVVGKGHGPVHHFYQLWN